MGRNAQARRLERAQVGHDATQRELLKNLVLAVQQLQFTLYGPPDQSAPGLVDLVKEMYLAQQAKLAGRTGAEVRPAAGGDGGEATGAVPAPAGGARRAADAVHPVWSA